MAMVSTPVSPYTLSFLDARIERRYLDEREKRRSVGQTLISYGLAIMMWLLIVLWSFIMPAHGGATLRNIVFVTALPLLVGAMLLCIPTATRSFAFRIGPFVDFLIGLSIPIAQSYLPGRFDDYSLFVLTIYCVGVHAMMGLRFLTASAISVALFGIYIGVIALKTPLPQPFVISAALWCFAVQLLAMRISYLDERSRKRDFFRNQLLDDARHKSDTLLLNILPASIAQRLKSEPGAIADAFDQVTVLFADLAGFTSLSARLSPADVLALLNRVFSAFDEIADRHGLEKIKTIGDAYMVAGGLPAANKDHACAVAEMALEMRRVIADIHDYGGLAMRIGIHTGPVVAGVIGKKKYSYDLWGDTVNTASRLESHGKPGAIQISDETRAALGERYLFETRGVIELKGKGPVRTHWLLGRADGMADG
jgi:class 3 adenylate cyclase